MASSLPRLARITFPLLSPPQSHQWAGEIICRPVPNLFLAFPSRLYPERPGECRRPHWRQTMVNRNLKLIIRHQFDHCRLWTTVGLSVGPIKELLFLKFYIN